MGRQAQRRSCRNRCAVTAPLRPETYRACGRNRTCPFVTYLARHHEQAGVVGEDRGWHRLSLGGDRNEPGCVRTGLCAWHKLKGEKTAKRTGTSDGYPRQVHSAESGRSAKKHGATRTVDGTGAELARCVAPEREQAPAQRTHLLKGQALSTAAGDRCAEAYSHARQTDNPQTTQRLSAELP